MARCVSLVREPPRLLDARHSGACVIAAAGGVVLRDENRAALMRPNARWCGVRLPGPARRTSGVGRPSATARRRSSRYVAAGCTSSASTFTEVGRRPSSRSTTAARTKSSRRSFDDHLRVPLANRGYDVLVAMVSAVNWPALAPHKSVGRDRHPDRDRDRRRSGCACRGFVTVTAEAYKSSPPSRNCVGVSPVRVDTNDVVIGVGGGRSPTLRASPLRPGTVALRWCMSRRHWSAWSSRDRWKNGSDIAAEPDAAKSRADGFGGMVARI